MCERIETYAKSKGFPDIRCFIVTVDSFKEYAICDDKEWLYGSPQSEAVAVYIDMMRLTKEHSNG